MAPVPLPELTGRADLEKRQQEQSRVTVRESGWDEEEYLVKAGARRTVDHYLSLIEG